MAVDILKLLTNNNVLRQSSLIAATIKELWNGPKIGESREFNYKLHQSSAVTILCIEFIVKWIYQ